MSLRRPRLPMVVLCAMLTACTTSTSTSSGAGGPIQRVAIGFVPADLTTGLAADSAFSVSLVHDGSSTQAETLPTGASLETVSGTSLRSTVTASVDAGRGIERIEVVPVDPLTPGWHVVRFDTEVLLDPYDLRDGVDLGAGIVAARFRVGSQPFLRSVQVCGSAAAERPPVVLFDFSEPVRSADGAPIVIRQHGVEVCSPIETEPEVLRADCAGLDPGAEIVIELPPLESPSGVPLVRGPDDGPVPPAYTITPDERDSPDAHCLDYPLVPSDAFGPLAGD